MTLSTVCESLEARSHFTVSPFLDPSYVFSATAFKKLIRPDVSVYQAVPGPGDRTYLLAERYDDKIAPRSGAVGLLTIIAVTADGKLDPSFGTGGVVNTGRLTQQHFTDIDSPGLLKLDDAGRLYYVDDVRVLRFRPDGSTDKRFGTRGAITYSGDSQPVALCDIAPVDGGVLVATTKTVKGVEYFSVLKIDRRHAQKAWLVTHDTGLGYGDNDGTGGPADPDDPQRYDNYQNLAGDTAQFGQSAGGIVLVHLETDEKETYDPGGGDTEPGPSSEVTRQTAVVTRFNAAGRGTEVDRREARLADGLTYLGDGYTPLPHPAVVLSANGRTVLVQTNREMMRLNLRNHTIKRYDLPNRYQLFENPRYHLLADGNLWVFDQLYKRVSDDQTYLYYRIYKFLIDGTPDPSFADNGVLIMRPTDFSRGDSEYVKQVVIGSSGRLYILSNRVVYNGGGFTALTLRRV